MIKLTLNKMSVPIPTDIKFKFVIENPYFTDASEYTEEISLSNSCPEVRKVFGAVHSHQFSKKKKVVDCELISDNHCMLRGKATTTEFNDSEVKLQLLGGNSLVNYMSKWSNLYIDEMAEMGKFIESWSQIFTSGIDPGGIAFAQRIMSKPEACEWIMLPAICDDYQYPINLFARYFPDGQGKQLDFGYPYGRLDNGTFALQPRLTAIVRRVISALGYEINRFDAEKTALKYIYYVNVKTTFSLHEMLPHWTVNEFLDEIQKFFNCVFVFDTVTMTCDIISRGQFFNENTITLNEVDDRFNVDLSEENDDIGFANLYYKNEDIDISKLSDEYINEHSEVVKCYNEEELEDTLVNGNNNTIGMLDGRQYVKHIEEEGRTKIEEINQLGCMYEKDAGEVTLRIVPAALKSTASDNIVLDNNDQPISYDSFSGIAPKGYAPNLSEEFNIDRYIHDKKEVENNKLDIMAVAVFTSWENLPNVKIPVMAPDPNPIRPGELYSIDLPTKLWCGWTYHVDDVSGMDYTDKEVFNPTLTLRDIVGYDTLYRLGAGSSSPVNKASKHEFRFFDNIDLKDINKTYIIRGHKYLCEKIELSIEADGIQKEKIGTFYQID